MIFFLGIICYFLLGVFIAHAVHAYEDLDSHEHDGMILCACFF